MFPTLQETNTHFQKSLLVESGPSLLTGTLLLMEEAIPAEAIRHATQSWGYCSLELL